MTKCLEEKVTKVLVKNRQTCHQSRYNFKKEKYLQYSGSRKKSINIKCNLSIIFMHYRTKIIDLLLNIKLSVIAKFLNYCQIGEKLPHLATLRERLRVPYSIHKLASIDSVFLFDLNNVAKNG